MKVWWDTLSKKARHSHPDYPNGRELKGDLKVEWEGRHARAASYASEEEGYVIGILEVAELKLRGKVIIVPPKQVLTPIFELGKPVPVRYVPGKATGTHITDTKEFI